MAEVKTKSPAASETKKPAASVTKSPAASVTKKPAASETKKPQPKRENRLLVKYKKDVVPALMKKVGYKNTMAVPKFDKIIINIGLGKEKDDTKIFTNAVNEIGIIAGQKPVICKARKSISNFKLREGQRIGAKVTLRGAKMYEFMDKLISVALPRVRDFRGISPTSFDGKGNYALGIKEQLVFPEISYEKIDSLRGFDVIIVTTAKTNAEALALLTEMGFPFRAGK